MSATRSKDEVLRSLEHHRAGISKGVTDASNAARQTVATVRSIPEDWEELLPEQALELIHTDWRAKLDWRGYAAGHEDQLQQGAAVVGFVAAGGVVVPGRRNKGSIVLGRRAMRVDKTSKQLGRAMAGIAAADGSLRRGRLRKGGGRLIKTGRRLAVLGGVGGGWAYVVTDEADRQQARDAAGKKVKEIADLVMDRVDEIQAGGGPAKLLQR